MNLIKTCQTFDRICCVCVRPVLLQLVVVRSRFLWSSQSCFYLQLCFLFLSSSCAAGTRGVRLQKGSNRIAVTIARGRLLCDLRCVYILRVGQKNVRAALRTLCGPVRSFPQRLKVNTLTSFCKGSDSAVCGHFSLSHSDPDPRDPPTGVHSHFWFGVINLVVSDREPQLSKSLSPLGLWLKRGVTFTVWLLCVSLRAHGCRVGCHSLTWLFTWNSLVAYVATLHAAKKSTEFNSTLTIWKILISHNLSTEPHF